MIIQLTLTKRRRKIKQYRSMCHRYQPTEDEIDMYRAHAHRKHELHPVDQFMLDLCEIPCLSVRIDICMTLWEFPWQYESTCQVKHLAERVEIKRYVDRIIAIHTLTLNLNLQFPLVNQILVCMVNSC